MTSKSPQPIQFSKDAALTDIFDAIHPATLSLLLKAVNESALPRQFSGAQIDLAYEKRGEVASLLRTQFPVPDGISQNWWNAHVINSAVRYIYQKTFGFERDQQKLASMPQVIPEVSTFLMLITPTSTQTTSIQTSMEIGLALTDEAAPLTRPYLEALLNIPYAMQKITRQMCNASETFLPEVIARKEVAELIENLFRRTYPEEFRNLSRGQNVPASFKAAMEMGNTEAISTASAVTIFQAEAEEMLSGCSSVTLLSDLPHFMRRISSDARTSNKALNKYEWNSPQVKQGIERAARLIYGEEIANQVSEALKTVGHSAGHGTGSGQRGGGGGGSRLSLR